MQASLSNETGIPFVGGAVGFIAYDYAVASSGFRMAVDDRALPDMHLVCMDGIAAGSPHGVLHLIALGIRADEQLVIDELRELIAAQTQGSFVPTRVIGSGTSV